MTTLSQILKRKIAECELRNDLDGAMLYAEQYVNEGRRTMDAIKNHPVITLAMHELETASPKTGEAALRLWHDAVRIAYDELSDGRYKPAK